MELLLLDDSSVVVSTLELVVVLLDESEVLDELELESELDVSLLDEESSVVVSTSESSLYESS